jgi:hypothetical protein
LTNVEKDLQNIQVGSFWFIKNSAFFSMFSTVKLL